MAPLDEMDRYVLFETVFDRDRLFRRKTVATFSPGALICNLFDFQETQKIDTFCFLQAIRRLSGQIYRVKTDFFSIRLKRGLLALQINLGSRHLLMWANARRVSSFRSAARLVDNQVCRSDGK